MQNHWEQMLSFKRGLTVYNYSVYIKLEKKQPNYCSAKMQTLPRCCFFFICTLWVAISHISSQICEYNISRGKAFPQDFMCA